MYSNFLLGTLNTTKAAHIKLRHHRDPLYFIALHAINCHGDLTPLERKRNQLGMKYQRRIMSRYYVDPLDPSQGRVIVETDDHWEETVVRLEEETCET